MMKLKLAQAFTVILAAIVLVPEISADVS